jgi:hypothetical protein
MPPRLKKQAGGLNATTIEEASWWPECHHMREGSMVA